MAKKGNNIYKRKDGRWEARYVKSVRVDGSKCYGSVYGATYREALDKQREYLSRLQRCPAGSCLTLSELMVEWLAGIKPAIKKSTYQKYESLIRNHVLASPLGDMQVRFLNSLIFSEFAGQMRTNLSARSVNNILALIHAALEYAEENHGIPAPSIRYVREPVREMRVLSLQEQARLEAFLRQDMDCYKLGVLIALYTGVRLGELCALRWEDVRGGELVISKTFHRIKDGQGTVLELTEPKTRSSNRVIPMPAFLSALAEPFRGTGTVLKTVRGKPVEPRVMQMTFAKYIEACGLPSTNFHALRHTFATRCVEAGFDLKSLSEILGHTDVKTTLNRYVHSSFELKQKNMELLQPAACS